MQATNNNKKKGKRREKGIPREGWKKNKEGRAPRQALWIWKASRGARNVSNEEGMV